MRFNLLAVSVASSCLALGCAESPSERERHKLEAQHCRPADVGAAEVYEASPGQTGRALEGGSAELIPCFQLTGLGSAENTLVIADDGAVLVAPAFSDQGNGFLSTRDHGEHWDMIVPGERGGAVHARVQPYLFMDDRTQRILYFSAAAGSGTASANGFDLSISDDYGESFTKTTMGAGALDWLKPVAAPARPGAAYPSVLYALAPSPISTPVPLGLLSPKFQQVERSRDGGETWQRVGGEQLSLVPADHGCPESEWVIYGGGVAASDGAIYYGLRRCTRLGIASSLDEGETWSVADLPGSNLIGYGGILSHIDRVNLMVPEPLAIDRDDNLYAVWVDADDALRYAVSKDRAATWSTPLAISAPSAPHAVFGALTTKEPGVIALAYYGGDGDSYHAYVAESLNALDPLPQFFSQRVSASDGPLFSQGFDIGYGVDILSGGDLVEIVQVKYAPDGDIWAAFVKDMCPGRSNQTCSWERDAHTRSVYQGAVARLLHRAGR